MMGSNDNWYCHWNIGSLSPNQSSVERRITYLQYHLGRIVMAILLLCTLSTLPDLSLPAFDFPPYDIPLIA
jgi:hypothetical protein